jgi:lysyl-tRNA synthetase class 2
MPGNDFRPTASWQNLLLRAETLKRLRAFFDSRGFVEVETPVLSHDTVIDRHLDPIPVTLFDDPRDVSKGRTLYLQTSPEFGMKRLLAAGDAKAIYQITRAFRGAEQGSQHNPEFTMLEWYRVGDDYNAGMDLLAELAKVMFRSAAVERMTYREAFERYTGVDPYSLPLERFWWVAAQHGQMFAALSSRHFTRDDWMNAIMETVVIEKLGETSPSIICDYPASQSALSQIAARDGSQVAERFELFYRGVELANGYHELLDASVLRDRNRANNADRSSDGKYELPEDSRLIEAMQHGLPACSGCALGVDRLVMLLAGASSIQEVMAFPIDRA